VHRLDDDLHVVDPVVQQNLPLFLTQARPRVGEVARLADDQDSRIYCRTEHGRGRHAFRTAGLRPDDAASRPIPILQDETPPYIALAFAERFGQSGRGKGR
jgi:hypothetical protein